MEVGGEGDYIPKKRYRYTVTTGMTSALRWAAMRAILMFDNCEGQSHQTVSTDQTTTLEDKREPKQIRTEVPLLGQTGSLGSSSCFVLLFVLCDNYSKPRRCQSHKLR